MRFVKTPTYSAGWVTTKGHYRNSKGKTTHHRKKSETPIDFVGVDGEGMTVNVVDSCGECVREHRYVLLGVGEKQIENPTGLQWWEVFQFLYAQYKPATGFVGFYLGYDFTQIFKTLPEDRARMLLTSEGRATRKHTVKGKLPHPVEARGQDGQKWHFDILANKRLRLRPKRCECTVVTCKCTHAPWMYVCDVGGFFQTSFLKAIDPKEWNEADRVVSEDEYVRIEKGKIRRSNAYLDDDMRKYNALENVILARVMRVLDKGLHGIGIHLPASKWFGPGQAAQQWMKNEGVPTREEITEKVPPWFLEAARMSYYGGWFEQFMHGIIPGDSCEYDVNSAYPNVIRSLPCLLHGTYTRGEGIPDVGSGELCLVFGDIWSPGMPHNTSRQHVGTALHRNPNGSIHRPTATSGWF